MLLESDDYSWDAAAPVNNGITIMDSAPEAGPKPYYCKCLTPNPAPFNREWCYCCGRTLRAVEQQSPAQKGET